MIPFPRINKSQYVVVRAELATGILLDAQYRHAISEDQDVWSICNDLDDAILKARKIFEEKDGIEVIVYNPNEKAVHIIRP